MVSILHLQNYISVMRYFFLRQYFWQDAALDLAGPVLDCRQGIRHGQPEVVVAVDGNDGIADQGAGQQKPDLLIGETELRQI